ncbi:MAG: Ppx/GppA phosphatase family protein, partial [Alphaproteobacteria bacterium]|nr:Ppx/GppA phosphatase family protein [Alphaproteobacteria bacterium]
MPEVPAPRFEPMDAADPAAPVGVIDIGSNSVRLVVYDGLRRAPFPIFNEKALCGLGRELEATGRLAPAAVKSALVNLDRYVRLAEAMGVGRLQAVATAAVREAVDGASFIAAVRRRCGLRVRVLSGEEEARLSALGVGSAFPGASGLVGDLGGGSLELVVMSQGAQGAHATLPIGPLRLTAVAANPATLKASVDRHLASLPWLAGQQGRDFFVVGGAWRALARAHMEALGYPLHVIHNYVIPGDQAGEFAVSIAGSTPPALAAFESVPSRRRQALPIGALVLARLLRVAKPGRIVFSAYGLREGCLFDRLPPEQRDRDPLIEAARQIARLEGHPGVAESVMHQWIAPLFVDQTRAEQRLRHAACLLADIGWHEHPDYRAEHAFLRILRLPIVGLDHPGRVFIANSVAARHGRVLDSPFTADVARLLSQEELERTRRIGLAMRLGYTLSGGVPEALAGASLRRRRGRITLVLSADAVPMGEVVE